MSLYPCYIERLNDCTVCYLNKYNINFVVDRNATLYKRDLYKWIHQYIPHSFTFKDVITGKSYLVKSKKSIVMEIHTLCLLSKIPTIYQLYNLCESQDKNLKWNLISEGDIQSHINNGYINITDQTLKLCLPIYSSDKDMVAASGNWIIQLNSNQKVLLSPSQIQSPIYNWKSFGENNQWIGIGVSIDGNKIAVAAINDYIYISTDGGRNWNPTESPRFWNYIAVSGDGNTIISTVKGGYIYVSNNFGKTWKEGTISANWTSVCSSINGTILAATAEDEFIYFSKDSGNTWLSRDSGKKLWSSISSSSDGCKLVAVVKGGNIFVSIDYGVTWAVKEIDKIRKWTSVSSSYDGTKLAASCLSGHIHISTDSGHSWVSQLFVDNWKLIYITPNGEYIVGINDNNSIYIYTEKEQEWRLQTKIQSENWTGISYSKKKNKFFISCLSGKLVSTTDYIDVDSDFEINFGSTLQLMCVKENIFTPIYFNGQIS